MQAILLLHRIEERLGSGTNISSVVYMYMLQLTWHLVKVSSLDERSENSGGESGRPKAES
jgi:hypothetical protein